MNSFKLNPGALLLLMASTLVACGGGGSASPSADAPTSSAATAATATAQADDPDEGGQRSALAVSGGTVEPPGSSATYTTAQLKACMTGTATGFDSRKMACLAGRMDGNVLRRVVQADGLTMGYLMDSGERCTVIVRSSGSATLRLGSSEYTHYMVATPRTPAPDVSYQHTKTGQGEWITLSSSEIGNASNTFNLTTGFDRGVPGWRVEASFVTPYGSRTCYVDLPDPPENVTAPAMSYAKLAACPGAAASPLTQASLACVRGRFTGVLVGEDGQPLVPRRSCTVGVRQDGLLWSVMGGVRYKDAVVLSNRTEWVSGGYYRTFDSGLERSDSPTHQGWSYHSSVTTPYSSSGFQLSIEQPKDGSAMTVTASQPRWFDAPIEVPNARCVATLAP